MIHPIHLRVKGQENYYFRTSSVVLILCFVAAVLIASGCAWSVHLTREFDARHQADVVLYRAAEDAQHVAEGKVYVLGALYAAEEARYKEEHRAAVLCSNYVRDRRTHGK